MIEDIVDDTGNYSARNVNYIFVKYFVNIIVMFIIYAFGDKCLKSRGAVLQHIYYDMY